MKQCPGQMSMFSAEASRDLASRLAWPGSEEARRMTAISGQKCFELSKSCGLLGWLERMLLGSSHWGSMVCWLTWKATATKQGRLYFRLVRSTPCMGETAARLWPTPAAAQCGMTSRTGGRALEKSTHLPTQVWLEEQRRLWPTPTSRNWTGPSQTETKQGGMDLQTAAKLYPTPTRFDATCGDIKGKEYNGQTQHAMKLIQAGLCGGTGNYQQLKTLGAEGTISAEERRSMAAGNGGQLNPAWVEAMMGFPPGWTE